MGQQYSTRKERCFCRRRNILLAISGEDRIKYSGSHVPSCFTCNYERWLIAGAFIGMFPEGIIRSEEMVKLCAPSQYSRHFCLAELRNRIPGEIDLQASEAHQRDIHSKVVPLMLSTTFAASIWLLSFQCSVCY